MTEGFWQQICSTTPTLEMLWMNRHWFVKTALFIIQLFAPFWCLFLQKTLIFLRFQVAEKIVFHLDNVYNIPNLRGRSAACRTNLPSNTSFRGFGVPQGVLVVENMVNDVAMVLGFPADQVSLQVKFLNLIEGRLHPSLTDCF